MKIGELKQAVSGGWGNSNLAWQSPYLFVAIGVAGLALITTIVLGALLYKKSKQSNKIPVSFADVNFNGSFFMCF